MTESIFEILKIVVGGIAGYYAKHGIDKFRGSKNRNDANNYLEESHEDLFKKIVDLRTEYMDVLEEKDWIISQLQNKVNGLESRIMEYEQISKDKT